MLLKEVAGRIMEHLVTDYSHGYSQYSRNGEGGYCKISINGKTYTVREGDRDCSSAVIDAYTAAGINCGGAINTGNMRHCMTSTGNFIWHPMSSGYKAKYGDIYLNEINHTAMCVGNGNIAHFRISENGTIDGKEGDQTGNESRIQAYYNYPWDGILECVSIATDGKDDIKKTIDQIADEVINGEWGDGQDRIDNLTAAGYNYDEVQKRVNEKLTNPEYYKIKPGDTLSEIAEKFNTTVYKLQQMNGITNPNRIIAGKTIRVK